MVVDGAATASAGCGSCMNKFSTTGVFKGIVRFISFYIAQCVWGVNGDQPMNI